MNPYLADLQNDEPLMTTYQEIVHHIQLGKKVEDALMILSDETLSKLMNLCSGELTLDKDEDEQGETSTQQSKQSQHTSATLPLMETLVQALEREHQARSTTDDIPITEEDLMATAAILKKINIQWIPNKKAPR